ncbi:MAG: Uma2 family endonuclease [Planctomycetaceae bacterium]
MASVIEQSSQLDTFRRPPFPVRRWTVAEYRRMAEAGFLGDEDRVELLEGWIVPKMTHNPPHDATIQVVQRLFLRLLSDEWSVRAQSAINTSDSEPEPDLAVVAGPDYRYFDHHPQGAELHLIIEVAESSIRRDRRKARTYAAAGIPHYWIINLNDRQIEVHSAPDAGQRRYREVRILQPGEQVSLLLDGQTIANFPVEQLLPPAE